MRIHVSHETRYRYNVPLTRVIQALRVTPRSHEGQDIVNWRVEVSQDCKLDAQEDAFGNIMHTFTADGPLSELIVLVTGEVETQDMSGVVRGAVERFPPSLYLRETALTAPDDAIHDFARALAAENSRSRLDLLHALLDAVNAEMTYDTDPTHASTTAAETFALKRGVCQDLAHIFIAVGRSLGIPSRYVGGYLRRSDGVTEQQAGHAWAEAYVPDLGWVGFDPSHGICTTDDFIRVAIGLDYLGAAPVRGARFGGAGEELAVSVHIDQTQYQAQSQG
ncbi:MAG: transglutaminase family protein [Xanthobacteraceae bacterium]